MTISLRKLPLSYPILFLLCLVFTGPSDAKNNPDQDIDPLLIKIADKNITKLEFEIIFHHWLKEFNPTADKIEASRDEFLSAFIKYQLFAQQALDSNIGKDLITEFEEYFVVQKRSKEFARKIKEEVLREAFIRSHYIIDADHILLAFDENADHVTKLDIYNKAKQLKHKIIPSSVTFEQIATDYSDDIYTRNKNGKLGLFTVFEQVYPIETAAYNTSTGDISDPVASRFGYHLIRTSNKIKIDGQKNVSHILIKAEPGEKQAKEKIFEIHTKLSRENFSKLASQHSHDHKSAVKGGELGTDRLIYALELKKHSLAVGEISPPFKTNSGWHIMRVDELIEFESYWQQQQKLETMIDLDSRVERNINSPQSALMQKVRQSYWELFVSLEFLRHKAQNIKLDINSESELINYLIDSKILIDRTEIEKKYPVIINQKLLGELFN